MATYGIVVRTLLVTFCSYRQTSMSLLVHDQRRRVLLAAPLIERNGTCLCDA